MSEKADEGTPAACVSPDAPSRIGTAIAALAVTLVILVLGAGLFVLCVAWPWVAYPCIIVGGLFVWIYCDMRKAGV